MKNNKWKLIFPILGIILMFSGISLLGRGIVDGINNFVGGLGTILVYISYRGIINRIKNKNNNYFQELFFLILLLLLYIIFFYISDLKNIIENPLSVLPILIYIIIYIKINFINKKYIKIKFILMILFSLFLVYFGFNLVDYLLLKSNINVRKEIIESNRNIEYGLGDEEIILNELNKYIESKNSIDCNIKYDNINTVLGYGKCDKVIKKNIKFDKQQKRLIDDGISQGLTINNILERLKEFENFRNSNY